jgi:hypothetical protein
MSGLNTEEIMRLGIEAKLCDENGGINDEYDYAEEILAFANLIAAAEREACAKVCEEPWQGHPYDIAKQIRARGNNAA